MAKTLTTPEACKLYGINRHTLKDWVKSGCPVAGKHKAGAKGGRPLNLFNPSALMSWALAHNKNPKGLAGVAEQAAQNVTKSQTADGRTQLESADPELLRKQGIIGALERARQQEMALSLDVGRARANHLPPDQISSLNAALTKLRAELRQQEMVALDYQDRSGKLVDAMLMERTFDQIAHGVRERIMALPNQLVPVLRPYLKNPDESGVVHDEIKAAIIHALTSLPDELPDIK